MQKTKNKIQNKKIKQLKLISEEFELPIALEELAIYIIAKDAPIESVISMLENEEEKVNATIKNILSEVKEIKSCGVKILSVKFDYCDSESATFGSVAYFKVLLQGTKKALTDMAKMDFPFSQKDE